MKRTIQHWFSLFLLMVLASIGSVSAQTLSIADFDIEAGGTKKVTIDLDQAGKVLLAFQADIVLPEGLTVKGKPKAVTGTMTDEFGDETEPTVTFANGRVVVYSGDGYAFNEDATSIVTLTLEADANFVSGVIKLTGITISQEGNVKIEVADAVTKVNGGGEEPPAPTTYDITITAPENGTVTVDKAKAEEGETITITATPTEGYVLEAITVNGTAIEDNTFVMPAAAVTIAATFKKKEVAPAGTPKLYIEDFSIEAGATKKVTINLDQAGNTLLAFQADIVLPEGLTVSGKPKAVTGTMTDEFGEETEPTVTFANGRIVVYSGDGYAFNEDATSIVTLTIAAAANFDKGNITLSNITISAEGNVKIEVADAVTKVNGGGEEPPAPTTYDITITAPENGTLVADKEKAKAGETITVTATPAEGYELEAITVNGAAIEGNTFVMPSAAVTIAATFKKVVPTTYDITITASENGAVVADKAKAEAGETVKLTVTPAEGYELEAIIVKDVTGAAVELSAENTFVMPAAAVTIAATFKKKEVAPAGTPKIYIEDFSIEAGKTAKVTIDLDQAGNTLLAFQADIVLPEGLTVSGKPKAVTGTMTDEFGEETEPTVTFANGRIVVYSGDGYAFNEDAKSIVSLTIAAADNFVSGEIKLSNITISADGNVKIELADAVTKVNGGGEVTPTVFAITVAEGIENGAIAVDKAEAVAGETITVTATPVEGYELEAITVTDASGATVALSEGNTFVMPAAAVTVAATFKEKEVVPPGTPKLYIEDFSIEAGKTAKVTIDLDQAGTTLLAFQADIVLPEGLTVQGKPKAVDGTMTDEFGDATEPTVTFANGRVVVYSGDGYAFNADAKSIVSLTIAAADNFVSGEIKLSNITISADGNVKIELADAVTKVNGGGEVTPTVFAITVAEGIENGAIAVDKAEAVAGETITVTATPADGYELEAITVNGEAIEGNTFVMPAVAVTVAASFKEKEVVPPGTPKLYIEDFSIEAGKTAKVTIDLDQAGTTLLAFQADIVLPEGLTVQGKPKAVDGTMTDEFGDATEPTVTFANGRVVVYSGDGYAFNEDAKNIVSLTIAAAENFEKGNITLTNITISAEGNVKIELADAVTKVNGGGEEPPAPTTYDITIAAPENGTVTVNKEKAAAGETITVEATPAEGYILEAITVNGNAIEGNTFEMPAEAVTVGATFTKKPFVHDFDEQEYLLLNVGAGLYLGAGNNWGTQASLLKHAEYVRLIPQEGDNVYFLETQVSNGGTSYYLGTNGYMDSGAAAFTFQKLENGNYTISAPDGQLIGYDGASTIVSVTLTDTDANAQWTITKLTDAKAALSAATEAQPMDATFLINDPNFGRNNRNKDSWNMEASNKNLGGGDVKNFCAESWHSDFTLSQVLNDIPNGLYTLTAQGFYRQDGENETNLPVFYANDATATFPVKTGTENSMTDASGSFSQGLYTIDPIYVKVEDGKLTIGAKLEGNTTLWCIWDNFELTYYGPNATIPTYAITIATDIQNGQVSVDKTEAQKGETITVTATPAEGYELETIFVNGDSIEGNTFTMPAEAVTVGAVFTAKQFIVKFVIGEEVIAQDTLAYGATITAPEAPEREGYSFSWGEVPATVPAADIIITGEYTVNTYVIRYYDENGEFLFEDAVEYGAAITLRDYTPTDPNRFTFLGWIGEEFETMPAHDLEYRASLQDGISAIFAAGAADVFSLNGTKVRSNATAKDLNNLPAGTYIIRGKKFIVK